MDGIRVGLSRDSGQTPDQDLDSSETEYLAEDLDDGVWNFSAQFRSGDVWGDPSEYQVKIDTQNPESFDLQVDNEGDQKNPRPLFIFESEDVVSGIDYYEILLNDEVYDTVDPDDLDESGYRPDYLRAGNYFLVVNAVDRAGNESSDFVNFAIESIPLDFDELPARASSGQDYIISGTTDPGARVRAYYHPVGDDDDEDLESLTQETTADEDGYFEVKKILERGEYQLELEAEDSEGRVTPLFELGTVESGMDRAFLLSLILLIFLIIVASIVAWRLWVQVQKEKEAYEKEEPEVMEVKKQAYQVLEGRIKEQIDYLESKVELSRSESKLLSQLKESLEISEGAKIKKENQEQNNG